MTKPQPAFTMDELAAAIAQVLQTNPHDQPGFTTAEIVAETGLSSNKVRRALRQLKTAGHLDDTKKKLTVVLGTTTQRVTCYSLKPGHDQIHAHTTGPPKST